MRDIINGINDAEAKAQEIKSEAQQQAVKIAEEAETRSSEIAKKSEAECRALKDKSIKTAEMQAAESYESEIAKTKQEAAKYRTERLKDTDGIVNAIVGRVISGGC